jgi:hypothetical protein
MNNSYFNTKQFSTYTLIVFKATKPEIPQDTVRVDGLRIMEEDWSLRWRHGELRNYERAGLLLKMKQELRSYRMLKAFYACAFDLHTRVPCLPTPHEAHDVGPRLEDTEPTALSSLAKLHVGNSACALRRRSC